MFIPDLDDFVLASEEEDLLEEVGRHTLSRGPWSTVAYLVKTRKSEEAPWEGPFLWLHRYQRVAQGWKLVSRFHTTDHAQLDGLLTALEGWGLVQRNADK